MLFAAIPDQLDWHEVIGRAISDKGFTSLQRLAYVIEALRKSDLKRKGIEIDRLCEYLEEHPERASTLGQYLVEIVRQSDVTLLLTESGIPDNKGFIRELTSRLERRIIPDLDAPDDLRLSLRQLFHRQNDYVWVHAIPDSQWMRLLGALGIGETGRPTITEEWASSLRILSHHIASLGLQPDITHRLTHLDDADSAFLMLSEHVLCFVNVVGQEHNDGEVHRCLNEALETTRTCRAHVEQLRIEKSLYGTSLRLTNLSFRLLQLLHRLEDLLILTAAGKGDFRKQLVLLFKEIVEAENRRNHIAPHVKRSGDLLAFQVVEHAAKKGSKYITAGWGDYWKFLLASMGGGLIVAVFAFLKLLLKSPELPLGVEAILFGVNYSVCFVIIYLTGSALATKQPAMTANTLAQSFERDKEGVHLERLVDLIVRVWRSQFISFVGNLVMALPVAFTLSILFFYSTGSHIVDEATSNKLLAGVNPWQSGALVYAAIAGVFLFFSGLVAGWVDNRNVYRRYPERIARHPVLVRFVGIERAKRIGNFWDNKLGILAGNVVLGFCLGSTATVGEILGLPIDIRHIAFSSAEYGISLEVLGNTLPQDVLINATLGVALIGLVNFLVSFGLSLTMALESRRVRFRETRSLIGLLIRRLIYRPLEWLFPPRIGERK